MNTSVNLGRIKIETYAIQRWQVSVEPETTMEQILDPAYLAHRADTMTVGDRVTCLWEDLSNLAELIVLKIGVGIVYTQLLNQTELREPIIPEEVVAKPKGKSRPPIASAA